MKRVFGLVLGMLFLLSACGADRGVDVREAWARTAAQGQNGAMYFVIQNNTRQDDELTGVSSEVAEAVEMHESKMQGDVMQMHPIASLPLEAGAEVTFKPGGMHVMLIGLKQDLKAGEQIEVTFHFKTTGDLQVSVPVREMPVSE